MASTECYARLGDFFLFCLNKFVCVFPCLIAVVILAALVVTIYRLVAKNNNKSSFAKRKRKQS